eukprot:NODE_8129_length_531_cov_30.838174_g7076_i0.p1 GENE.NODE_8129_length_531_cov_30.838174_g7076_i0~~NODE_8129_length_531_cov_30.838174_g7076_i0.p1  ORF type:complete len:131 (+),score=11.10 NODE_8129_length_531_cov_30.838174_g7076_i0:56-394(+)
MPDRPNFPPQHPASTAFSPQTVNTITFQRRFNAQGFPEYGFKLNDEKCTILPPMEMFFEVFRPQDEFGTALDISQLPDYDCLFAKAHHVTLVSQRQNYSYPPGTVFTVAIQS